ncbi:MAG: hypothetical protein JSS81_10285 [Acidobacteria bacterium]|nr:hypothetical protein [Acidobacteriota bacterium]
MLYIIILVLLITAIGGIIRFFRTRELSSKLGREVADHELTSLNSWMEAERSADRKNQSSPSA